MKPQQNRYPFPHPALSQAPASTGSALILAISAALSFHGEDLSDSLHDGVPLLKDRIEHSVFRISATICHQKCVVLFGSVTNTQHPFTLSGSENRNISLFGLSLSHQNIVQSPFSP